MAQQVNEIYESFETFKAFKSEITNALKLICETQVQMKQELFVLRNQQITQKERQKLTISQASQTINSTENVIRDQIQPSLPPTNVQTDLEPSLTDPLTSPNEVTTSDSMVSDADTILYVTDTVGDIVDLEALENVTKKKIIKKKAHSAVYSTDDNLVKRAPSNPSLNFTDVISSQLETKDHHSLIIQAGAEDITNLITEENPSQYLEYFKQETIISAENIFTAAEKALELQPSLKKVVVMKHIPRFDPISNDPLSLKTELSTLFNSTLTKSWINSKHKSNILIGEHKIECKGAKKEARYRQVGTGFFDGIHLLGRMGKVAYTDSVLDIVEVAGLAKSEKTIAQHQPSHRNTYEKESTYSVTTQNRFNVLSNQGNC